MKDSSKIFNRPGTGEVWFRQKGEGLRREWEIYLSRFVSLQQKSRKEETALRERTGGSCRQPMRTRKKIVSDLAIRCGKRTG
ncbi:hypothetical protein [Flavisolibacter nicotianae]|uniref:hypothetical protein n=1 Tax=Flavisolibacter nicotianae TaxID=2364882 RepID=UPI0013C4DA31|nr:hypothetical protein [Flavisolibacter nicotianae]